MATGSPGTTGTTGPRPCPTPSWKEEELSGLGEGTEETQGGDNYSLQVPAALDVSSL